MADKKGIYGGSHSGKTWVDPEKQARMYRISEELAADMVPLDPKLEKWISACYMAYMDQRVREMLDD